MNEVLFLVHRLPYPPDKGDKIRSYHLLQHLAEHYEVHLGCFIDDASDERHRPDVERLCATSKICRLNPLVARMRSAIGLVTGEPLSLPYYCNRALQAWVDETLATRPIRSIVCYSSPMGQYVRANQFAGRRIMDFVDVDSDKWRQYAESKRAPMRWIYAREARRLLEFERAIASEFDASVFVTQNEVELFDELAPESCDKHYSVANGVADDYFDPDLEFPCPFEDKSSVLVFTGMMNYWANVDAVKWFVNSVFPQIRESDDTAEFWIVGASPTEEVVALGSVAGVHVTGRVADVRPYLKHATVVVAPLKIARGIQNKVLEALAMGCGVICTPQAASGLHVVDDMPIVVADHANDFAKAVLHAVRQSNERRIADSARQYVLDHYGWGRNLDNFERIHRGVHQ